MRVVSAGGGSGGDQMTHPLQDFHQDSCSVGSNETLSSSFSSFSATSLGTGGDISCLWSGRSRVSTIQEEHPELVAQGCGAARNNGSSSSSSCGSTLVLQLPEAVTTAPPTPSSVQDTTTCHHHHHHHHHHRDSVTTSITSGSSGSNASRVRDVGCGGDDTIVAVTLDGRVYMCDVTATALPPATKR